MKILLNLFAALSLLVCGAATAAPIVTPGFVPSDEDLAGVRLRSFANTGGEEVYLGVPDLGTTPRAAQNLTWVTGTNSFEYVYNAVAGSMTATITNGSGGSPYVLNYSNFAADLAAKGKSLDLSDVVQMQITVADRDDNSSVALNNVMLDGDSLGSFATAGFSDWTVTNFDFTQGFTLTGDLELSGPFSNSQEKSRVEIKLGANAIPEPAGIALALFGAVGLAVARYRQR